MKNIMPGGFGEREEGIYKTKAPYGEKDIF